MSRYLLYQKRKAIKYGDDEDEVLLLQHVLKLKQINIDEVFETLQALSKEGFKLSRTNIFFIVDLDKVHPDADMAHVFTICYGQCVIFSGTCEDLCTFLHL